MRIEIPFVKEGRQGCFSYLASDLEAFGDVYALPVAVSNRDLRRDGGGLTRRLYRMCGNATASKAVLHIFLSGLNVILCNLVYQ